MEHSSLPPPPTCMSLGLESDMLSGSTWESHMDSPN